MAVDSRYKSKTYGALFGNGRIKRGRNHRVHHIVVGLGSSRQSYSHKRNSERGPTYRVCSHRGEVASRSGELSVKELPILMPGCLFNKRRPNKRFLRSGHSGFHDARPIQEIPAETTR